MPLTEFNFNKVSGQKPATLLKIEFLHRHISIPLSADVEQLFSLKTSKRLLLPLTEAVIQGLLKETFLKTAVLQSVKHSVWWKSFKNTHGEVHFC